MSGVVRYRQNEETGAWEMYDARCHLCIDFTPNWVECSGPGWVAGDREAMEGDPYQCTYCNEPVYVAETVEDTPTVQYAKGFSFVTVYEMDRIYGGPEEGGWWYDAGTVVLCRQVPADQAEAVRDSLREEYPHTGKRYSVIYPGYGDYDVLIDDEPGKDFPLYTPHYE